VLEEIGRDEGIGELLYYQAHAGRDADRAAIATWIERSTGVGFAPERVVLTDGAQHAIAVSVAGLLRPGDVLACECLSYPGFKALAALLDIKLVGLALDNEGLLPESFAAACRDPRLRALYTIPTLQNPTGGVMSEARRREIARIASAHDVTIIEDDVYGFLLDQPPRPIAAFAPDHSVYVGSASKSLAPGLRVGWACANQEKVERIAAAMRATTYMATPTMTEILTRWIHSGDAERLVQEKREAAERRRGIADRLLDRWDWSAHARAFHLWLTLPEGWRAEDFAATARRRGVGITPGAAFHVGRGPAPDNVRICLGSTDTEAELEKGLQILASLLAAKPAPYLSVV